MALRSILLQRNKSSPTAWSSNCVGKVVNDRELRASLWLLHSKYVEDVRAGSHLQVLTAQPDRPEKCCQCLRSVQPTVSWPSVRLLIRRDIPKQLGRITCARVGA